MLGLDDDVREYSKQELKELIPEMIQGCIDRKNEDKFQYRDIYVTACFVKWQVKPFLYYRVSCPTPVYNQNVFKYHYLTGSLEYLWTIPGKFKYYHILNNKQRYYENKETRRSCQFVVLMETGELLKWVKKENGEKPDAALSITHKEEH